MITECYIGSTEDLHIRKIKHKSRCNNPNNESYNFKVYKFIRANGGYDNWDFEVLGEVDCNDKIERYNIERDYIEMVNSSLNTRVPGRTKKEYDDTHKEQLRQYGKEYRETHKEQKREYDKEYRETHKEEKKEWGKEYYQKHKEEILEKGKIKMTCECGSVVRRYYITTHRKSKKHQAYLMQSN